MCVTLEEASLGENKQITKSFLGPFRISLKKDKNCERVSFLPYPGSRAYRGKYAGKSQTLKDRHGISKLKTQK